jgi:hypothetical protein
MERKRKRSTQRIDSDEESVEVLWEPRCQAFRTDDWATYQPQLFQYVRDEVKPEQKVLSAMKAYAVQRGHISLHKSSRPWERADADPSDYFNCGEFHLGFGEKSWHCFYRRVLEGGYEHRHHHRTSEERRRDRSRPP